jgi:hypothetical protein
MKKASKSKMASTAMREHKYGKSVINKKGPVKAKQQTTAVAIKSSGKAKKDKK